MTDLATGAGLVIVDKPSGMSSHDVVARVRRIMRTRKVGHAGTLDPMATGVLVLGIERATKLLGLLALTDKVYVATIRLGASTTTDDAEGEVVAETSAAAVTDEQIAAAIANLTGDIMQRPSSVSAIKVDGERAYARVRAGESVELAARPITVSRFVVVASRRDGAFLDLDVEVECTTGTYIRALARDLGAALGVGGHLTALRRTRVGPFALDRGVTLDELETTPQLSLGIDEAIATSFPVREVSDKQVTDLGFGRWLEPAGIEGVYAAVAPDGRAISLLKEQGKRASPVFVVRPT